MREQLASSQMEGSKGGLVRLQEFNSVEAIKSAVQYGLGAALVSSAAIAKEMDLGLFRRLDIQGVRLTRTLSLVRLLGTNVALRFLLKGLVLLDSHKAHPCWAHG